MCGFSVSDLLIPDFRQPWELDEGRPSHIASSLDIMIQGPLGSAAFNNEFGRPCTTGYFRTYSSRVPVEDNRTEVRGFHKPVVSPNPCAASSHQKTCVICPSLICRPIPNTRLRWLTCKYEQMVAGGIGTVRPQLAIKKPQVVKAGAHLVVLGKFSTKGFLPFRLSIAKVFRRT